ncbi:MAG: hypothetical protein JOZ61_05325 [Verrucomicrobia bacterium]|nr:hypothetical protein [Verrucomicrobiota bacterium]
MRRFLILLGFCAFISPAHASLDDAIASAINAMAPYVKQGFTVRDDEWGGDLGVKEQKAIPHTIFKGNEYLFCMATDVEGAHVSIHLYDNTGKLVESDSWQKGRFAAVRIVPSATGTYYIIVEVVSSPKERTNWAMVYGYK